MLKKCLKHGDAKRDIVYIRGTDGFQNSKSKTQDIFRKDKSQ